MLEDSSCTALHPPRLLTGIKTGCQAGCPAEWKEYVMRNTKVMLMRMEGRLLVPIMAITMALFAIGSLFGRAETAYAAPGFWVQKLWEDEGHEDERPSVIHLTLFKEGEVVATAEMSETGITYFFPAESDRGRVYPNGMTRTASAPWQASGPLGMTVDDIIETDEFPDYQMSFADYKRYSPQDDPLPYFTDMYGQLCVLTNTYTQPEVTDEPIIHVDEQDDENPKPEPHEGEKVSKEEEQGVDEKPVEKTEEGPSTPIVEVKERKYVSREAEKSLVPTGDTDPIAGVATVAIVSAVASVISVRRGTARRE
jgi:hypothetical protein